MKNLQGLTSTAQPWLHLWTAPNPEVRDALVAWELAAPGKRVVRIVRGKKCTTVPALFDEFAAALQFPDHFGNNWDAFADCLRDLHRFGEKSAVVVCLIDADKVLAGDAENAATLADVFATCLADANAPEKPLKPRPMHVVFLTIAGKAAVTSKRWRNLGLELNED